MRVSVVIPALNEETLLPRLLESLGRPDLEVIVADAGSGDRTREIAEAFGAKVVPGGLPAKGRNQGAKVATGDLLAFVDADVILPPGFWERALGEMRRRDLQVASVAIEPVDGRGRWVVNAFYNWFVLAAEKVLPHGAMCILVAREVFEKAGGFDEGVRIAEDHEFVRRAAKQGRFGLLRRCPVLFSTRRFRRDGWVRTYLKFVLVELHMLLLGPVRSDLFRYTFDRHVS